MSHTPGKLRWNGCQLLRDDDGRVITDVNGILPMGEHFANARRLAACWNVMEALPTELIEKMKSVVALYYEVPEQACLRAERDELLAACKAAVTALGIRNEFMPIGCGEFGSQMLNAIARAEGASP